MKKVLFAAFIAVSSVAVPSAQAAPAWANFTAARACKYVSWGHSAGQAGEKAAKDVLTSDRHGASAMRAYLSSKSRFNSQLQSALLTACPNELSEAARRTGI